MTSLPLPLAAFVAGLISFLSPCVLKKKEERKEENEPRKE